MLIHLNKKREKKIGGVYLHKKFSFFSYRQDWWCHFLFSLPWKWTCQHLSQCADNRIVPKMETISFLCEIKAEKKETKKYIKQTKRMKVNSEKNLTIIEINHFWKNESVKKKPNLSKCPEGVNSNTFSIDEKRKIFFFSQ